MSHDAPEQRERVSERIAHAVEAYCADALTLDPPRFVADDLRKHVERVVGPTAPGSADRILRLLRQQGRISYEVIDRRRSLYELSDAGSRHASARPADPPERAYPPPAVRSGGEAPTTDGAAAIVAALRATASRNDAGQTPVRGEQPSSGSVAGGASSLLDERQASLLEYLEGLG